jgi:hypothetical protein
VALDGGHICSLYAATRRRATAEPGRGCSQVRYEATVAGAYTVCVVCGSSGEPLPGTPLRCVVRPGPVHAAASAASLSTVRR